MLKRHLVATTVISTIDQETKIYLLKNFRGVPRRASQDITILDSATGTNAAFR